MTSNVTGRMEIRIERTNDDEFETRILLNGIPIKQKQSVVMRIKDTLTFDVPEVTVTINND